MQRAPLIKEYVVIPVKTDDLSTGIEVVFDRKRNRVIVRCYGEDAVFEEIDYRRFVQVSFVANDYPGARRYTYVDPFGETFTRGQAKQAFARETCELFTTIRCRRVFMRQATTYHPEFGDEWYQECSKEAAIFECWKVELR